MTRHVKIGSNVFILIQGPMVVAAVKYLLVGKGVHGKSVYTPSTRVKEIFKRSIIA